MKNTLHALAMPLIGLTLLATGCAVLTHRQYTGSSLPSKKVAVITTRFGPFAASTLDGKPFRVDRPRLWRHSYFTLPGGGLLSATRPDDQILISSVEVLPDTYELEIKLLTYGPARPGKPPTSRKVTFTAKAGHDYRVNGVDKSVLIERVYHRQRVGLASTATAKTWMIHWSCYVEDVTYESWPVIVSPIATQRLDPDD